MSGVATRGYKQNGGFVPKATFVIAILQNKKLNKTKQKQQKTQTRERKKQNKETNKNTHTHKQKKS